MSEPKLPIGPQTYQPEMRTVRTDVIDAAITAITAGIEHTKHGRFLLKNRGLEVTARAVEGQIEQMERTLEMLRGCGPEVKEGE